MIQRDLLMTFKSNLFQFALGTLWQPLQAYTHLVVPRTPLPASPVSPFSVIVDCKDSWMLTASFPFVQHICEQHSKRFVI